MSSEILALVYPSHQCLTDRACLQKPNRCILTLSYLLRSSLVTVTQLRSIQSLSAFSYRSVWYGWLLSSMQLCIHRQAGALEDLTVCCLSWVLIDIEDATQNMRVDNLQRNMKSRSPMHFVRYYECLDRSRPLSNHLPAYPSVNSFFLHSAPARK